MAAAELVIEELNAAREDLEQSLDAMDAMNESLMTDIATVNADVTTATGQPLAQNEDAVAQTADVAAASEEIVNEELQAASSHVHLRLKMLDDRVFTVDAELAMTVADFRVQVADVTQVPVDRQRLIYRGT